MIPVAPDDYRAFAARLTAGGLVGDPWVDGQPRFDPRSLSLSAAVYAQLRACGEAVTAVHHELAAIVAAEPALLAGFFGLTDAQRFMWGLSAPAWHGVARADLFLTAEGPRCCELNCDTPSGTSDALALGLAAQLQSDRDPNRDLGRRFLAMVAAFAAPVCRGHALPTIGIVYPTELTEDLGLISLYRSWLEARGARVVLGSPFNLRAQRDGRVALMDTACDVLVRHYKTDWWGERLPVWDDEAPLADPEPLVAPLRAIAEGTLAGRLAVVNPFGAVLPQNKRALAFMWEERGRFSPAGQRAIAAYVPFTARLEALERTQLRREREAWVLKSDYGCEGEEVIVGAEVDASVWDESLAHAIPRRWVAQRRFLPLREPDGDAVNYGLFVIAGRAAGLYARRAPGATDRGARSVAVAIEAGGR
jgi:hypothetical protein